MTFEHVDLRMIPGLGNDYFINRDGQPYSRRQGGRLKPLSVYSCGHYSTFKANGMHVKIHVAILLAFHGPRPSPQHEGSFIDGNAKNITLSNLQWATRQTIVTGEVLRGTHHRLTREDLPQLKLTTEQVSQIKQRRLAGEVYRTIAADFGVTIGTIAQATTGRTWNDVAVGGMPQLMSATSDQGSRCDSSRGPTRG